MSKKVSIGAKPTSKPATADAWVSDRVTDGAPEPVKRLTIDIPESLHRAIKSQTASRGTKMADEIRDLLLQKYGKQ